MSGSAWSRDIARTYIYTDRFCMYSAWLPYMGALLFGAFLMIAPGLLIAVTLRQRGIAALGLAPVLSAASIALGATFAPVVGVRWSLMVPFVTALVIAVLGWVLMSLSQRFGFADSIRWLGVSEQSVERAQWSSRSSWVTYAAVVVGALLVVRQVVNAIGSPENVSQTFDVNFHVNAVRYIADTGNASSFFIASMTSGNGPVDFYPAVWHGFTSLIYMYTGVSVVASTNIMMMSVAALAWPLSLMYLMRVALNLNIVGVLAAGVAMASFAAFPVLLVFFGILYPNALGIAIVPAVFALGAQLVRVCATRYMSSINTLYLVAVSAVALALVHPNVLISWLLFSLPLIIIRMCLQIAAAVRGDIPWMRAVIQLVLLALYPIALKIMWDIIRPVKDAGPWNPELTDAQAWGEALTNSVVAGSALILISAIALVGAVVLIVRRDQGRWIVLSWLLLAVFYVMIRSLAWEEDRYFWVGVWYHDPYRLSAMFPLFAAPLAAYGAQFILEYLVVNVGRLKLPAVVTMSITIVIMLVGVVQVQRAKPLLDMVSYTYTNKYQVTDESPLLSTDEKDVIEHIHDYVPEGDTLIVEPYTGGALAYALTGYNVTAKHTLTTPTEQVQLLNRELKNAQKNPAVCQAVRDNRAYYVLDFGTREVNGETSLLYKYPGLKDLKKSGVVSPVYTKGEAGLYKVTVC